MSKIWLTTLTVIFTSEKFLQLSSIKYFKITYQRVAKEYCISKIRIYSLISTNSD